MKRRVLLFTRRFPYFKTEAFLEAEIDILAKEFEEVVIIPSEIGSEIRSVPSNVKIDETFSDLFQNKRERAVKTIFNSFFWKTLWLYRAKIKTIGSIKHIFQFSSSVIVYKKYLSRFQFSDDDLFYTYWLTEPAKAIVDLKKKIPLSIISRAHRYDIYEGISATPDFWPYRKEVLEGIDNVYSISDDGKHYLQEKYKVFDKIKVSKLGVFDRGKIAPIAHQDDIWFVSVSRVDPMKRVGLIAKSIVEFARANANKNVVWTHFGDGQELSLIKANIPKLPNLTIQLNGAVPNTEIYKFYEVTPVSVFINLSSSEGIPVSIMEAQSFGIPVVATDVGGSGEIVKENVGKLISANPTVEEAVFAITDVLSQELSRTEIKSNWDLNFNAAVNYTSFVEDLKLL